MLDSAAGDLVAVADGFPGLPAPFEFSLGVEAGGWDGVAVGPDAFGPDAADFGADFGDAAERPALDNGLGGELGVVIADAGEVLGPGDRGVLVDGLAGAAGFDVAAECDGFGCVNGMIAFRYWSAAQAKAWLNVSLVACCWAVRRG